MTKISDLPPADRARLTLETLIRHSDERGNVCAFDVWPYAHAWARLEADPSKENLQELQRLASEFHEAQDAWRGPSLRSPERQKAAALQCFAWRPAIEAGDGALLLDAVMQCATHGLVMPGWLAAQFAHKWNAVSYGDANHWGHPLAFGPALPKHANIKGIKAKAQTAPWAYETAQRILAANPDTAFGVDFYEQIGEVVGMGHSRAEQLIIEFVEENDHRAPLAYLRERLLQGRSLEEAHWDWSESVWAEFLERTGGAIAVDAQPVLTEGHTRMPERSRTPAAKGRAKVRLERIRASMPPRARHRVKKSLK